MSLHEKNLLGWIMRNSEVFIEARRLGLSAKEFRTDGGKKLWEVFESLASRSKPFDLAVICDAFGAGDFYPVEVMAEAPVTINVKYVVNKILEISQRKNAASILSSLAILSDNLNSPEEWESIKSKISTLARELEQTNKKSSEDIEYSEGVGHFLEDVEAKLVAETKGDVFGLPTGLRCLDESFGGWQPSSLYFIAARPGLGKTTLALNACDAASKAGKHVYFCSNEMSATQIIGKHHSMIAGIPYSKIMRGDLNEIECDKLFKSSKDLLKRHVTVGETNGRYIETFEAECIARKREGKLDFAIIDYVQQMHVRDRKYQLRAQELTFITDRLKNLCRTLKIPIVALAQINRAADESMPTLAHLKDSGSLEQDADAVVILHIDKELGYVANVAKNRFGKVGVLRIQANLATSKFYD